MKHSFSVNFNLSYTFCFGLKDLIKVPLWRLSSGENLPYSSCHFPNHKLVFLQILYHCSVSWKITPLHFFSSNVIYLAQKEPIKVEILTISSVQITFHKILAIFETTNQFFFKICLTLQCHETCFFCTFFIRNFIYFIYHISYIIIYFVYQQKQPMKVQILWNFTWAVESLKFCTSNKVSAKKVQNSYLSWRGSVMQSLKQNWLVVSDMTWGIF